MPLRFAYCPFDGSKFSWNDRFCITCGEPRLSLSEEGIKVEPRHMVKRWHRTLYEEQPYSDDYVDESFLSTLTTNANLKVYHYWFLSKDTLTISHHISNVVIILVVWKLIFDAVISVEFLISLNLLILLIITLFQWILFKPTVPKSFSYFVEWICERAKSPIVVYGFLWILSPVLQTLTQSFSDDTVAALTIVLVAVHFIAHDYGSIKRAEDVGTSPFALNAAMFALVLLASRLETPAQVFAFLSFSIICLSSVLSSCGAVFRLNENVYTFLVVPMFFVTAALLLQIIAGILCFLFVACILFITFFGPFWFIRSQKYKNEIQGPWDLPNVHVHS